MHYRNGREAKVGDPVVGITYNRKGQIAGTLVSLTPGMDSCSAKVGFVEVVPLAQAETMVSYGATPVVAIQGTEQHGSGGPKALTVYREDYTHAGNLWHADDAAWVDSNGNAVQPPKTEAA